MPINGQSVRSVSEYELTCSVLGFQSGRFPILPNLGDGHGLMKQGSERASIPQNLPATF